MSYTFAKRLFDLVFAALGLLLVSPAAAIIGLLVKLSDGGPIHYAQTRIGRHGRPFRLWKFRSMVVNADKLGPPLTKDEDERITRIGRFLRKTKLDELPQLWNVLRGEMSFVGPRPEVPRYVDAYTPKQREILEYKPGITDMATLLFRNEEALLRGAPDVEAFYLQHCLPKKIELNEHYARQASLHKDIWIIAQTLVPYWVGVLVVYGFTLTACLWLAYLLRFDFDVSESEMRELKHSVLWIVPLQVVVLMWRRQLSGLVSYFSLPELRHTCEALGLAGGAQFAAWYASGGRWAPGRSIIVIDFVLALVLLVMMRSYFKLVRERYFNARALPGAHTRRVGIIGAGEVGCRLALDIASNQKLGKQVVAFFDDDPGLWHKRLYDVPVVGMPECLLNGAWRDELDEILVALPGAHSERVKQVTRMLRGFPLTVTFVSSWPILEPVAA